MSEHRDQGANPAAKHAEQEDERKKQLAGAAPNRYPKPAPIVTSPSSTSAGAAAKGGAAADG